MISLLQLSQNIWRDNVVYFLSKVEDLARLDCAAANRSDRATFHANIKGCKRFKSCNRNYRPGEVKWLALRNIVLDKICFSRELRIEERPYIEQILSEATQITFTRTALSQSSELLCLASSTNLTHLNFSECELEDIGALSTCRSIINLTMYNCSNVTDISFAMGISGCVNLRQCYILNCKMLNVASIVSTLYHCAQLTKLELVGAFDLERIFDPLSFKLKLETFICFNDDPETKLSGASIRAMGSIFPALHTLDLYYPHTTVEDADMDELAQGCTSLTSLQLLGRTHLTDVALYSIADHLTGLQSFRVDPCARITDAGVIPLSTSLTRLHTLYLNNFPITDAALRSVGAHCSLLSYLNVTDCSLLTDFAFWTLNVKMLETLHVSGTRVTGTFAVHIFSRESVLKTFYCCVGEWLNAEFVLSLSPNLALTTLSLGRNQLAESDWIELSTKVPNLWSLCVHNSTAVNEAVIQSFRAHCPRLCNVHVIS